MGSGGRQQGRRIGARAVLVAGVVALAGCADNESTEGGSSDTASVAATSRPTSSTPPTTATSAAATSSSTIATTTSPVGGPPPSPVPAPGDAPFRTGTNPCTGAELPEFAAFDLTTGDLTWSRCSGEKRFRDVVDVNDDLAFVAVADDASNGTPGALIAIDLRDGRSRWERPIYYDDVVPAGWPKGSFAGGGVVVLADPGGALIGLDAASGEPRWRLAFSAIPPPTTVAGAAPVFPTGVPGGYGPVAGTAEIAVVKFGVGQLAGLDRATGKVLWTVALEGEDQSQDVAGLAAAAVAGDTLFMPAGEQTVAIDMRTGEQIWRGDRVDDPWATSEAVVGAAPGSEIEIAALDSGSGAAAWTAPGTESYGDRIALGDGGAYVIDQSIGLVGYELADGAKRWQRPAGSTFLGQPQTVVGDTVLLLWESALSAVRTSDGTVRWGWDEPVASGGMNNLDANGSTAVVAVNSRPFTD